MNFKKKYFIAIRLMDVLGITAAWFLAYLLRWLLAKGPLSPINPFDQYVHAYPAILVIWILVIHPLSLPKLEEIDIGDALYHLMNILKAVAIGMFVTMSFSFMAKEFDFGRSIILFFTLLVLAYLLATRYFLFKKIQRWHKSGLFKRRTVIVGAEEMGIRVLQKIEDFSLLKYDIIGFVDDGKPPSKPICERPLLGKTSQLARIVKEHEITHVFIANSELDNEELFNIVEKFEGTGVTFSLLTNIFEMLKNNRDVHVIGTLPIIEISHGEFSEYFELCKRVFDIVFSLAILLLFLPIGILIAIGIKLDSRGPIFIAQKRIGLHGQPFPMFKFRSMHAATNLYEHAPKHKTDPRITRVGKILRQFSLDELPQFINVLRGEMSVVGPRPEMEFIVKTYRPWQKKRLSIKPGITGLWQILGRKNLPLNANLEYDFYYIKNRSFALDLSILIKTIPVVLIRRGAF